MKRFLLRLGALLFSTVFMLSACKNQDEPPQNTVYRSETAEISSEITGDFDTFEYSDGKIYFLSEFLPDPEGNFSKYFLNSVGTDGNGFSSEMLAEGDNMYICPPKFDADGTLYYVISSKIDSGHKYTLYKTTSEGNKSETDITEAVTSCAPDFFPSEILVSEGGVFISGYNSVIVLDSGGALKTYIPEIVSNGGIHNLARGGSGRIYAYIFNGYGFELQYLDEEKAEFTSAEFPFDGYNNIVFDGRDDAELFVSDGTALYILGADGVKKGILNLVQSGVSSGEVQRIFPTDNGGFVCAGKSMDSGAPVISELSPQTGYVESRKEIVLAGTEYSIDTRIENAAVKFNNTSTDNYITIKKYPWDNIDQLNLDIISGNIPDILISDSSIPVENYISKGVFTDLYPFIDGDSELDRSDFLQNLLSSCETDGKLYCFTDRFKVYTALGKTSIFGEDMGINMDKLQQIAAARPEGTETFPGVTKQDILTYALELSGDEFIDYKKGTCRFDSDSFIAMMKYANGYIDGIDYDSYFDDSFWSRFDTMFADESALLMTAYLSDYTDIFRFERINFGEPVTAVGFPCENRIGTSFVVDTAFSISEKSDVKQEAWEFIRTLLLPKYQDKCDCFPVRTDSLEKSAAAAMKHDPNRVNQAIVIMGQMALASGKGDIGEPQKADIDHMNAVIASADGIMSYNASIRDIITEEAETFFSGAKTAEEAAQIIQSRVRLYLEEHS